MNDTDFIKKLVKTTTELSDLQVKQTKNIADINELIMQYLENEQKALKVLLGTDDDTAVDVRVE